MIELTSSIKELVPTGVTGCPWVDAERLARGAVSDTALRARRDEWEAIGVFDKLVDEALHAYDTIIGLDLTETAADRSVISRAFNPVAACR